MREKGRKWDGRSRIPTDQYKQNYDDIFKKKEKKDEATKDKKQNTKDNR
jgi:hypothetical protein